MTKLTDKDGKNGGKFGDGENAPAANIVFMSAWGSVGIVVSGSLFNFITVDNLVQVALGIPNVIAKRS